MFFKIVLLHGPLGKIQYYAIQIEFRVRGSPHIHSSHWILNLPKLKKINIDDYRKWVDSAISSDLLHPNNEPELFELAKNYQIHHHSKTCCKYRNKKCRFRFG